MYSRPASSHTTAPSPRTSTTSRFWYRPLVCADSRAMTSLMDDGPYLGIAGGAADDDLTHATLDRLSSRQDLLLHPALREALRLIERDIRHERAWVAHVAEQARDVREVEERVGLEGHGDARGDPVTIDVQRLVLGGERERRDDGHAARSHELAEQRDIDRLDRAGEVVAQEHRLPVGDGADDLALRDEQAPRESREPHGVDAAGLQLLRVQ